MKKNKKTFAQRAKEIQSKYSRAEFDPIERRDMMKELAALRDEQESVREAMNIADKSDEMDQMAKGGYFKYDGKNKSQYLPNIYNTNSPALNFISDNPYGNPIDLSQPKEFKNSFNSTEYNNTSKYAPYVYTIPVSDNSQIAADNVYNQKLGFNESMKGAFRPLQTSFTPYAVSAAASMLGDLGSLASMYKTRPDTLNLPRVAPTKVNLQPERELAGRTYNTNRNIMLKNSRDVSSPAGAYANQIAGLSSLQDSYGNIMGQSYMNEANTNAQLQQQANMTNAQFAAEEAKTNLQLRKELSDVQSGMIGSISETIPKALRDYRSDYSQNMLMNIMGKDYGLYEPVPQFRNSWERFLYSMKGPQYRILNRQYADQKQG